MSFEYSLQFGDSSIEYDLLPYKEHLVAETEIDESLLDNKKKIDEITKRMEDLKVDADMWDYSIAAFSGVVAGIIDIFFVGNLSFKNVKECHDLGSKEINELVNKAAKRYGFEEDDNLSDEINLKNAIRKLEENAPLSSDQDNIKNAMGGGLQHHFRDFTHHPTIVGWIFSIIMQFSGLVFGTNPGGMLVVKRVEDTTHIGKDPYEKVLFGTIHWFFHMLSDIAGSSSSPGKGTGLPGPILSLMKELDAVRVRLFKGNATNAEDADKLTKFLSKLFNGTAFAEHDESGNIVKDSVVRFDFRTEVGMLDNVKEASKMFVPVLINECVIRTFYFIKRFVVAVKNSSINSLSDMKTLEWNKILPINNATLTRMLTISVATMEIVDISDAAIHGAIEAYKCGKAGAAAGSAGGPYGAAVGAAVSSTAAFWKTFALRINYVGIGRLVICFGSELSFEHKRETALSERISAYDETLNLMKAKVLFREVDMWISAAEAGQAVYEAYSLIGISDSYISETTSEISENIKSVCHRVNMAESNNPGLLDEMLDSLKWEG